MPSEYLSQDILFQFQLITTACSILPKFWLFVTSQMEIDERILLLRYIIDDCFCDVVNCCAGSAVGVVGEDGKDIITIGSAANSRK